MSGKSTLDVIELDEGALLAPVAEILRQLRQFCRVFGERIPIRNLAGSILPRPAAREVHA